MKNKFEQIVDLENEVVALNRACRYDEAIAISDKVSDLISQSAEKITDAFIGSHAINRISIFLNTDNYAAVEKELRSFDRLLNGKQLPEELIFKRYYLQCEKELRFGNYDFVINRADKALEVIMNGESRCRLYLLKGIAEVNRNKDVFRVTSLSDALAEAENSGNQILIAEVYKELSRMFSVRYFALGIYFLRKAEVIYARCGDIHMLNDVYMYRATNNMMAYESEKYQRADRLLDEAKRLIDLVNERFIMTESEFQYFQRTKAYVYKQEDLLNEVMEYYCKVGSKPEFTRTVDMYVGICLNKGLNWKVKKILPVYKKLYLGKDEILRHIEGLEKMLESGPIHYVMPFDETVQERTILDILDQIAFDEEMWALNEKFDKSESPSYEYEGMFQPVEFQNGKVGLAPCVLSSDIYYRGQNTYYEDCRPSLYRRNMTEADIFVERLKYEEFKLLIQSHPINEVYKNDIGVEFSDGTRVHISLNVDYLSLAQHYGIKTELIDLTVDKFVAAFFACTDYDEKTDSYSVHKGDGGNGVFYTYAGADGIDKGSGMKNRLRVVGLQPFSRPGEQAGYVLEMKKEENFNDIKQEAITFRHNEDVARFIFNYTNRQKRLFPGDILDGKVSDIKSSNYFSRAAFDSAVNEFYKDEDRLRLSKYLQERNIHIVPDPIVCFTEEEVGDFWKRWEDRDREKFFDRVYTDFYSAKLCRRLRTSMSADSLPDWEVSVGEQMDDSENRKSIDEVR